MVISTGSFPKALRGNAPKMKKRAVKRSLTSKKKKIK